MKKEKDFYQVSLKLLLKNNGGRVLALKGRVNGSYAGYYDLPGGRIDMGEFKTDFSEIIRREVAEELGNVDFEFNEKPVAIGRHLIPATLTSAGKDIHILNVFFEGKYLNGDLKISSEHDGHKWLDLSKADLAKYFTSGILEGIRMYIGK